MSNAHFYTSIFMVDITFYPLFKPLPIAFFFAPAPRGRIGLGCSVQGTSLILLNFPNVFYVSRNFLMCKSLFDHASLALVGQLITTHEWQQKEKKARETTQLYQTSCDRLRGLRTSHW